MAQKVHFRGTRCRELDRVLGIPEETSGVGQEGDPGMEPRALRVAVKRLEAWVLGMEWILGWGEYSSGLLFPSPRDLPHPGVELGSPTL